MKKTKKILSLMLVVLMVLSVVPIAYAKSEIKYEVGDIVQFGSYPQTEVKDEALIAELNALTPEWNDWTNYGYYSGNGEYGSMTQGDWMRYTDITYNGNKYRGVKFTQYRPDYTSQLPSSYGRQCYNGYITNTVYWFKFELLDWRILDPATGFIMCETIIDSQPYSNSVYYNSDAVNDVDYSRYAYFNDSSYTNYANDYETSSIRKWLNEDFYDAAFTDAEKNEIIITTLNNEIGDESFDSNPTNDKIFLISLNEAINSDFGFDSFKRQAQGSDYAKSQGLNVHAYSGLAYNNNSSWLLRSADNTSSVCRCIGYDGYSSVVTSTYRTGEGIRPALRCNWISDDVRFENADENECDHAISRIVGKIPETCTEVGFTGAKICKICGAIEKENSVIPARGHCMQKTGGNSYAECNQDGCDFICNCNCHGTFLNRFFFIILNFFQKLFGLNKVCACGESHY